MLKFAGAMLKLGLENLSFTGLCLSRGPWWFFGFGAGSSKRPLEEAPGQKGPLMVLGLGAGSSKRPLAKKGPWWFWGLGRGRPRGPWPKRTPGEFEAQGVRPSENLRLRVRTHPRICVLGRAPIREFAC